MAHLSDGTRLHVDSFGLWEVANNLAHLLLGVNKPVACDNQSRFGTHSLSNFQQVWVGLITGWEALDLAKYSGIVDGTTAINIVVGKLGTNHYVLQIDIVAITTSTSA